MWGSNPFTNYQANPYGGPQSFSMGQGGYQPSQNGQFNPGALDFSGGGGMLGGGSSGTSPMPSWGGGNQGFMSGGFGGGQSPWMGQSPWQGGGMFGGGMGQRMQMPRPMAFGMGGPSSYQGMNPAARNGGMNYQTMPYAQPTQPAAQAADPSGMNGIYGNVVHNGSFDSAGATLNPLLRSMIQS